MSIEAQELLRDDLEIKTALITVYDKTDIIPFSKALHDFGVRLITTGKTFGVLSAAGIPVIPLTAVAPFPEMLDGRVKTLQPQIFGGILANKAVPAHLAKLMEHNIGTIDMVVCNFYPFEMVAAREGASLAELLENIDIGGPSLVRSAVKNHGSVCVVPKPVCYPALLDAMRQQDGRVPYSIRAEFAEMALKIVKDYETAIHGALSPILSRESAAMPRLTRSKML
jgi:phosphoribosylaminoimidazolecarboxamide formyltransferase/IMP cyclohydrolase